MSNEFLLYGSTGYVGEVIAHMAVQRGLQPIIAGRNAAKIEAQAAELGVEHRIFSLDDTVSIDKALGVVPVVLHCAGPYIYTSKPMAEACLRTGTHYLDLTGEIPVFQALLTLDPRCKACGVMLMPGSGFDVVATDCLALHLKQRLPTATRLTLAFHSQGPASLPPGTANVMFEMIPYGFKLRRNGQLEPFPPEMKTRMIDFGKGPVEATLFPWGDVFTAYYSTGIPNIEDYTVIAKEVRQQMSATSKIRPLFKLAAVRRFFRRKVKTGSTAEERAKVRTSVWGEVEDDHGHKAVSRLHGPEASVVWTTFAALTAVQKVLDGKVLPGFQTPAMAYGADFVLECDGVTREDVI
jgi:short subunit dehydrogenase-like uncharacterized protein